MAKKSVLILVLTGLMFGTGSPAYGSDGISDRIEGVELKNIDGWFANRYPWMNIPRWQTVQPVPRLSTPGRNPSPAQIMEQDRQLNFYGSGADILEFNVCPGNQDYNQWLSNYLGDNSSRPFFVLYEHVNGNCNYVEFNGPKDMDLPLNRKAFLDDIGFIFRNVILPNEHRYVTVNGRAAIFMWSVIQMEGDFASLLEEVKSKYPVFFIGSVNILEIPFLNPSNYEGFHQFMSTLRALDGFMEYATGAGTYQKMISGYRDGLRGLHRLINQFKEQTGRSYLVFPTFQFAFDDTKYPGRKGPPLYPSSRGEVESYASWMRSAKTTVDPELGRPIFDDVPVFAVYDELFEGAAVIESLCTRSQSQGYRWVGCGTARLEILQKYFGK